jgi:Response regulator of the LytR/AlgR family
MKAIIIEDEKLPAQSLEKMLGKIAAEIKIEAVIQTIEDSVDWLTTHDMPKLIFMDIHLADGSSFTIFEKIKITCPIIFTTAYDEYALKAFEVNSLDYLLKPIREEELERAINKIRQFTYNTSAQETEQTNLLTKLAASLLQKKPTYKSSLLVAVKDKLIPLSVSDIAYIFIENRAVKAVCFDGKELPLDFTLDELITQLNPQTFYRANRQYIISRNAVKSLSLWFGNRVAVNLTVPTSERILVSRTHVKELKQWLTG